MATHAAKPHKPPPPPNPALIIGSILAMGVIRLIEEQKAKAKAGKNNTAARDAVCPTAPIARIDASSVRISASHHN